MTEIFMPKAGMDMREGRLIRWLKEIGDYVEKDEPIIEIETDKITMEAESPGSGILLAKLVKEDTMVPVLAVLGYVGERGEAMPETAADTPAPGPAKPPVSSVSEKGGAAATPYAKKLAAERGVSLKTLIPSGKNGEIVGADVPVTPLARNLAAAKGVDLTGIEGTGFGGKIRKADVLSALSSAASPPSAGMDRTVEARRPLRGIRKVVGERMYASYNQVPTVMQSMKVDMTALLDFRARINAGAALNSPSRFYPQGYGHCGERAAPHAYHARKR